MSRATKIIQLLEAGGLEPADVSTMKVATKGKQPKPGGAGDLTKSPGFVYGSAGKKSPEMADSELEDEKVDSPVLTGNMFKRDASKDKPVRRQMLTPMTGLRG